MESVVNFFLFGARPSSPSLLIPRNAIWTVCKKKGTHQNQSSRVLLPPQELEEIVVCARKDCRLCRVRITSGPLLPYPVDFAVRFRIVALFAIRCASETAHHKRGYGAYNSLSLSLSLSLSRFTSGVAISLSLDLFVAAASLLLLCALFARSLALSLSLSLSLSHFPRSYSAAVATISSKVSWQLLRCPRVWHSPKE